MHTTNPPRRKQASAAGTKAEVPIIEPPTRSAGGAVPPVAVEADVAPRARVDIRSAALALLALIATVWFIQWARPVLIPITLATFLSYASTPVVKWLRRHLHMPEAAGAACTLTLLVAGLAWMLTALQPQLLNVLDLIPPAAQKVSNVFRPDPGAPAGAVQKMKTAASEIEKAAIDAADSDPANVAKARPQPRPAPAAPELKLSSFLLVGTATLIAGAGQFVVIIALAYFLLLAGDGFRRTLVRITGNTLSEKKVTVQILDEIDAQIQRYLLVQVVTSALFGLIAGIIFMLLGLKNALFWGFVGGVLHLVPYIGPTAFVALATLVAFVQFDGLQPVLIVLGSVLVNVGFIGLFLVPWLTQRVGSVNAVTVFVALLVWGWLWGVWGLLLGVPIVMAIKAVCDRIPGLQHYSEFLGHNLGRVLPEQAHETVKR